MFLLHHIVIYYYRETKILERSNFFDQLSFQTDMSFKWYPGKSWSGFNVNLKFLLRWLISYSLSFIISTTHNIYKWVCKYNDCCFRLFTPERKRSVCFDDAYLSLQLSCLAKRKKYKRNCWLIMRW